MDEADLARRVGELEARLREIEDRAAILEVIARYGPAADSSDGEAIQALFSTSGTYELEGWSFTYADMPETVKTDLHQRYETTGCAHVMSLPRVEIRGDRAVALNYSQVFVANDGCWVVDRCAANRWDLAREPDGWKVTRRVNRLLNGSTESHALLAGVEPPPLT
jgi:SnoaL-like domain